MPLGGWGWGSLPQKSNNLFYKKKLFGHFLHGLELLRLSVVMAIFTDEKLRLSDVIFLAQVYPTSKKDKA